MFEWMPFIGRKVGTQKYTIGSEIRSYLEAPSPPAGLGGKGGGTEPWSVELLEEEEEEFLLLLTRLITVAWPMLTCWDLCCVTGWLESCKHFWTGPLNCFS